MTRFLKVQGALPGTKARRARDSGESPRAVTRCGGISSGAGDVNAGARRVFANDAQLLHAEAERVRMQAESFGGIAGAVDAPSARTQDLLDMRALDRGQGGGVFRCRRLHLSAVVEQRQHVIG